MSRVKCIFDSDSDDDSNDELSLGTAVNRVKCIFDSDSDDSNDRFNKSDSDNDSNNSDDDSDSGNDDSFNNSDSNIYSNDGNNSNDIDGDSNDSNTRRLTRSKLVKTLAEKFLGVSKCQHMATDPKHEAELDYSTIKGKEESSTYHILKGWPIIIAQLRKESKELEKNRETKSKSTIAKQLSNPSKVQH